MKPLPLLRGNQQRAADPSSHASLSASAGTGKTQVLTARVLRLLLRGVAPEAILCLTFTKAGAAEMANRLGERLASWVRMKEADLAADLAALGETVDPPMRERARRLFARVIEAPGGLRIQTIHSFAQSLLAYFPAEAGVAPGFEPIEGRAEAELARRTLAALLSEAEASGDTELLRDVETLSLRLGEQGAERYLMDCAKAHDAISDLGDPARIEDRLRTAMDLPQGDIAEWVAGQCQDGSFDCDLLRALAAANRRWGKATGLGQVEVIDTWLSLPPADRAASLPDLALVVFTGTGELRKVRTGQRAADPDYETHAARLAEAIGRLRAVQEGAAFATVAAAGLRAGAAFGAAYVRAKRLAGVADFDDLIRWTRALLEQEGMGEWIRFKLDQRTDHVLVDEAQDTNADQWAIVDSLVTEYFSGAPEAEHRFRTLFMVGDFKQAIFGFQGTDPREFETFRKAIAERASALEDAAEANDVVVRAYLELSINASFRSSPAILQAVDAVIEEIGSDAMGLSNPAERHEAARTDRPGRVELWSPFGDGEDELEGDDDEEGWIGEPARRFADRIAQQVQAWLDEAPLVASTGRPLTPGDILILVRSRTELASLIVARLFARRIAVAGIDRLHLAKPLAVKDLLAAIAFAVQPHDDLNLAGLLVSPLIGWDQERLYAVAHGRRGSLWEAIQARRLEDPTTHSVLAEMLARADFVTPARFLETILSDRCRDAANSCPGWAKPRATRSRSWSRWRRTSSGAKPRRLTASLPGSPPATSR